jgi:hypothetical protein
MTSTFHRLGRLVFKEINQYGSIPPFKGSLIHRSVRQKIHLVWDGVGKDPFYLFLDAVDDSHPSVFFCLFLIQDVVDIDWQLWKHPPN